MSKQDSLSLWKQRIEEQKTVVWESGNRVNPNSFPLERILLKKLLSFFSAIKEKIPSRYCVLIKMDLY